MNILERILLSIIFVQLCSCHSDNLSNQNSQFESTAPVTLEPPPPPFNRNPFQHIKTEHLKFVYGDKIVNFTASLSTNRVFKYNENDIQTFSIYAETDLKSDTFFFALPLELTKYWHEVTLTKASEDFFVVYKNNENELIKLQRIFLGEYNLNTDNIYMRSEHGIK